MSTALDAILGKTGLSDEQLRTAGVRCGGVTVPPVATPQHEPPRANPAIAELRTRPQWVAWKSVPNPGAKKPRKLPFNPHTGEMGSSTDPNTWTGYDTATEAVPRYGLAGVGFVFTEGDPFAGIDLDDCRNPGTGAIDPWAQDIITKLHSYTEVSPSGTGVKIFIKGKLPANAKHNVKYKTGSVEVYDTGRYFTVTGQHVPGTPTTIEDRQAELTTVYADVFGEIESAPTAGAVAGECIGKGKRHPVLAALIGKLIREHVPQEGILQSALALNKTFCPALDESEVANMVRDMVKRYPSPALEETMAAGTPDWPALPATALSGLAGDIVRTIEPHSEADPTAILIQALTAVGNLIGPKLHCIVESTRHALTLCPVLVGETSKGRKGTSWGHVERLCKSVDRKWAEERVTSGLSSAEGLINEVRDDPDASIDRRLLVIQPEYGSVLKIMAREGNTLSPLLRSAWDSGNLRTLVKHNPLKATGAHISVIGHITRSELLRYLSDTEQHNGFANRLLWCCVRRSRCLPEGGSVPEAEIAPLAQVLTSVVEWARQKGDCEIRRDEPARGLWAVVYPRLSAGRVGLLGAATSRAEAQVLRLSAIYAVLDCSAFIRVEHLRAALGVWDYCFASARFIFGNAIGDPVADRIREALTDAGEAGLTRTQIRDLLGRHASADRIAQALTQLVALGIATGSTVTTEGRSIELWTATEATKATEV